MAITDNRDQQDRDAALLLANEMVAFFECSKVGERLDFGLSEYPMIERALRYFATNPQWLCCCIGGSTYNDGDMRRCDLCGLPVPLIPPLDDMHKGDPVCMMCGKREPATGGWYSVGFSDGDKEFFCSEVCFNENCGAV